MATHFLPWLRQQTQRPGPVGDLARDFCADSDVPSSVRSAATFLDYIKDCHACDEALDAYKAALALWRSERMNGIE